MGATDLAGAKYEWTGPASFTSEEQFPSIVRSSLNMDGQYNVIGIVSGCATFPANLKIDILENPMPYLGEDETWDGTFNGQLMEAGVYMYDMYELLYKGFRIDGSTFMDNEYGTVTIVR